MSEAQSNGSEELNQQDELEVLKARARLLGVEFSNNIGLDTLKERVAAKLNDTPAPSETTADTAQANPLTGATEESPAVAAAPVKRLTLRQHLLNENMKLVRVRVTNMDPKKADLQGEFFTVANEYLGTITKFVPYGEVTDDGYHVPYCIYKMLLARKFLQINSRKNKKTGQLDVSQQWVREFALDILPDLTEKELHQLATEQAATGRID